MVFIVQSRGCLLQLSPILHGNNCFCAHSMICFSKTCVGRLLGELHRSRETETTTILSPKNYKLANVVHQKVKVEQSFSLGSLSTGCLLNLYITLLMRLVRLRKHFSQGNPIKISRGLHTCPLNRLWFRVLHTDPINILTMNTSASLRWSSQFNIRVVVVGIGQWHTRIKSDL